MTHLYLVVKDAVVLGVVGADTVRDTWCGCGTARMVVWMTICCILGVPKQRNESTKIAKVKHVSTAFVD